MTVDLRRPFAVSLILVATACPPRTPQTTVLTTTPATGTSAAVEKPMREVVELLPGEDPFRYLPNDPAASRPSQLRCPVIGYDMQDTPKRGNADVRSKPREQSRSAHRVLLIRRDGSMAL